MTAIFTETENKILAAARAVFLRKGLDGARMQEIADEAGINKALLHYYFRNKEKLFRAILKMTFSRAFPDVMEIMKSGMPIHDKIAAFIDRYTDILREEPFLPGFMLREIQRDPSGVRQILKDSGMNPSLITGQFRKEMEAGNIRSMNPDELMINIISLTVFPFAMAPLAGEMFFQGDTEKYAAFLDHRKKSIAEFVTLAITPERKIE